MKSSEKWTPDSAMVEYWNTANRKPANWVEQPTNQKQRNWVKEKLTNNKVKVKVANTTYTVTLRNKEKTEKSPIRDIFRRFSMRYRKSRSDRDLVPSRRPRKCTASDQ